MNIRKPVNAIVDSDLSMGWKLTNAVLAVLLTVVFGRQSMIISSLAEINKKNAVIIERISTLPPHEWRARVMRLEGIHRAQRGYRGRIMEDNSEDP